MQYEAVSEKGFSHSTEDKGKEMDLSESDGEHYAKPSVLIANSHASFRLRLRYPSVSHRFLQASTIKHGLALLSLGCNFSRRNNGRRRSG